LLPLVAIVTCAFLTVSGPLPVLPLFVHDHVSTNAVVIGALVGLQSVTTVLSRRHAGAIADTRGPKDAVMMGLVACAAAGLSYIVAGLDPSRAVSIGFLAAGRVVLGLGESLLLTGAITWGIARVGPENAGTVMSWNGIAMYASFAAGAPLGTLIFGQAGGDRAGFVLLGVVAALTPLVALALAASLPAVPRLPPRPVPMASVLRMIWPWGSILTLQMVGFGTISSFLSLAFLARGWSGAGIAFTGFGLAVIATRLAFGGLPDRLGGLKVAAACLVVECAGQAILAVAPAPGVAMLGCVLTGAGCALAFPALGVEAMRRVPAENRGVVIGLFSAFQDIAFGATGPIAGVVAIVAGYSGIFAMGTLLALVGLAILHDLSRRHSRGTDTRDYRPRPDGPAPVRGLSEERP